MPIESAEISRNWIAVTRKRFTARRAEKPATKAGQIRALWPEIKAALAEGQSMKTIREWLEQDAGVVLSATSLTSYISRIRRRESREPSAHSDTGNQREPRKGSPSPTASQDWADTASHTPLASAMAALRQRRFDIRELHGDGDPTNKNLILKHRSSNQCLMAIQTETELARAASPRFTSSCKVRVGSARA